VNNYRFYSETAARSTPSDDIERLGRAISLLIKAGHGDQGRVLVEQIKTKHFLLADLHREEYLRGKNAGTMFALQIACMRDEENKQTDSHRTKLKPHALQFDMVIKRSKDPEFLQSCATTLRETGLTDYSRKIFSKLLELDPKNYVYRLNLASIDVQLAHFENAYKQYATLLEQNPGMRAYLIPKMTQCLEQTGDFDQAVELYEEHIKNDIDTLNNVISSGNIMQNLRRLFTLKDGQFTEQSKLENLCDNILHLAYLYTMDLKFDKADITFESLALFMTGFISTFGEQQDQEVSRLFVNNTAKLTYHWVVTLRKRTTVYQKENIDEKRIQSVEGLLGLVIGILPQVQNVDLSINQIVVLSQLIIARLKNLNLSINEVWGFLTRAYTFAQHEPQVQLVVTEAINTLMEVKEEKQQYVEQLMKWISENEKIHVNNPFFWEKIRALHNHAVNDPSKNENCVAVSDILLSFKDKQGTTKSRKYRVIEETEEKAKQVAIDFESLNNQQVTVVEVETYSWKDTVSLISDIMTKQNQRLGYTPNERFIHTGIVQASKAV
jgi:tetratricopeptide (TPR) repeat protein